MHQSPFERFDALSQKGDERTDWNRMIYLATGSSNPHANTNGNGKGNANGDEKDCGISYVEEILISVIVPRNVSLLSSDSAYEKCAITSNGYSSSEDSPQAGNAQTVIRSDMIDDSLLISVTTWINTGEEGTIVEITGHDGGEFSLDTLSGNGFIEVWFPYTPKSHTPYANHRTEESENLTVYSDIATKYNQGIDTYFAAINNTEGEVFPLSGFNGNIDGSTGIGICIGIGFGANAGDGNNNNNNSNDMGFIDNSHNDDRYDIIATSFTPSQTA